MGMRVGCGLDAHRFGPGRPLMLGTIAVDHPEGLVGHSDGDAVAHALCDALLSAAGQPDLGALFPPGNNEWAGASGERLLSVVMERVERAGLRVVNAHAVVVCERPRLGAGARGDAGGSHHPARGPGGRARDDHGRDGVHRPR